MRAPSWFAVLLVLLPVGCSRPLAPVSGSSADRHDPVASELARAGASDSVRVRLKFVGSVVTLDASFQPRVDRHAVFTIVAPLSGTTGLDTIPAYSVLKQVQWLVRPGRAGARLGLDPILTLEETPLATEAAVPDSSRVFPPGMHQLTLEAPARAGGGTVTVQFFAGFVPGSWWAGPDPALWPASGVEVADWSTFSTVPAWPPDGRPYFGPDSFRTIPSQRRPVHDDFEVRTFYEIHGNRIYARAEGDTVHQDSWIVLCNGGYDKDSPYIPKVDPSDPALPPGYAASPELYAVLIPQGLVGSPTGFSIRIDTKLADGTVVRTADGSTYPDFRPTSVFRQPWIVGYRRAQFAGKAYAVVRAEDSDALRESFITDAVGLADRVDAGGGTPKERLLRRRIITFHVSPESGLAGDAMTDADPTPEARAAR